MSKIVFFCIPAHGHTNPTLGVVRTLVDQGHQVWYYSYDNLKEKIEETGATFISCDAYDHEQNLSPEDGEKIAKDIAFSTTVLVNTTFALGEVVEKQMKELQPDCIVGDSMAVWAKLIAHKLGIPFISSTTTFAFNKESAKIMRPDIKQMFSMLFSMHKVNKQIQRLKDNGYRIHNILDIIQNNNETDTIVYTSKEFQPCSESFSDRYEFIGPSIRPVKEEIIKKKEKLVYISMGTVNNKLPDFYKECIEAFRDTDYQVIMSVGNLVDKDLFGNLPENISVHSFVDQISVLNKADVFLSHCGMNSVSESLYFEVPLVMAPQTQEQIGVANRVEELGAGIYLQDPSKETIFKSISKVLNDERYKKSAKRISESFRKCKGVEGAVEKILSICKK